MSRRKQIRDAALGLTVGRWVDEVEKALDDHVDLKRPVEAEARDLLRSVIESLARQDLGDKVVFMDSNTFDLRQVTGHPQDEGEEDHLEVKPDPE